MLRRLLICFIVALALLRAGQTVAAALPFGLPGLVGGDYVAYYTAGTLVLAGDTSQLYALDRQREVQQRVEAAAGVPADQRFTLAFDNPPPAALVLAPFALLPPGPSYVVWTGLNLTLCLVALGLLTARQAFPWRPVRPALPRARGANVAPLLLFFPVLLGLFYGQMIGLVLVLYALAVHWLVKGSDARAGVALAALAAIKPQYALVLLLLVALKGRWRVLTGAALAGAALLALSAVLVGAAGLLAYQRELALLDPYAGASAYLIDPGVMINWRAVLLNLAPALSPAAGFLLTNLLALATIAVAAFTWRGPWQPTAPAFAWQVLAATAAALLASYHSHAHGAVILLVPYLLLCQTPEGLPASVRRLAALAYWPPLVLLALAGPAILALRLAPSLLLIACLLLALALVARQRPAAPMAAREQRHAASVGATP